MISRVSIIGLGKLGSPMAAAFASKGFSVVGVDADVCKVERLNLGEPPVFEPRLGELLHTYRDRLRATTDIVEAVRETQATFVVVPTPSEPDGHFSLQYVLKTCDGIAAALRGKSEWHLVVITSTISPLSMDQRIRPHLERESGKQAGEDFGLCYSPEFIALGSVIRDMLNPDFVLIGESDPMAGDVLTEIYKRLCDNNPSVARMNFVNAELTKLAVNTFVTTKISFANMLARICEHLPGANVDVVTRALGLDSRIGPKYLQGAISYGGPCFPRDNLALTALAHQIGAPVDIAKTTDHFNRWQIRWLAEEVQGYLPKGGTVGILGLTYKPETDVVEEAVGIHLARELAAHGISVMAYDPAGEDNAKRVLGDRARFFDSAESCIAAADVVVVATPWQEFFSLSPEVWGRSGPPRTVIDCWRMLGQLNGLKGVRYIPLGVFNGTER